MKISIQHYFAQSHHVISLQILFMNAGELGPVVCYLAERFYKGVVEKL